MTDDLLALGRNILRAQPFSTHLGTILDAFSPGHAELSLVVSPLHMQHQSSVHGGILAYLADSALAFAGGSLFGDAITVEMKINFLKPARGDRLRVVADVVGSGEAQAVCRCDVFCDGEAGTVLCAAAQGTIRRPPAKR